MACYLRPGHVESLNDGKALAIEKQQIERRVNLREVLDGLPQADDEEPLHDRQESSSRALQTESKKVVEALSTLQTHPASAVVFIIAGVVHLAGCGLRAPEEDDGQTRIRIRRRRLIAHAEGVPSQSTVLVGPHPEAFFREGLSSLRSATTDCACGTGHTRHASLTIRPPETW